MYVIIVYDIDVKRVAKVCKYLRQHLNWVQNSVFEGELTKAQLARVKSGLLGIINDDEDSVLIYQMRHEKWMDKQVLGIEKNPVTNLLWRGCDYDLGVFHLADGSSTSILKEISESIRGNVSHDYYDFET